MHIGLIGLGKMGFPLALNMQRNGHQVLAYDLDASNRQRAAEAGIAITSSLPSVALHLNEPRAIWVMVPAGEATEKVIAELAKVLAAGDTVIDGGNSHFKDSMRRHELLAQKGIHFLDCGTSGGVSGALNGACTMVGGEREAYEPLAKLFEDISVPGGHLYTGPPGSGHFVKMVHNGIEYGMMQAIAEGFEILAKSPFGLNLRAVAGVWNHGSVIRSWLMELTESAFAKDARLEGIRGVMHASGEGKWTVETAIDMGVPAPVIALSLIMRQRSQQEDSFAGKVVAALRNEFGGHEVVKAG